MPTGSMEFLQQLTVVKTVSGNVRRFPFVERTDTLSYQSQENGSLSLVSGVEQELEASVLYLKADHNFRVGLTSGGSYLETSQFFYKGVTRSFFLLNLASAPLTVEYLAFTLAP